ncbi:MAG: hypothetical protein O9284_10550 [Steroidobacteraceae bacterium]|nr:hypothetical protein [Steroidobacteraceae bacterium]
MNAERLRSYPAQLFASEIHASPRKVVADVPPFRRSAHAEGVQKKQGLAFPTNLVVKVDTGDGDELAGRLGGSLGARWLRRA